MPILAYIQSTMPYWRNILAVLFVSLYFGLRVVLCGPFGNTNGYKEQLNMVKNASERAAVPHGWMQLILFGGVNSTH